MLVETNEWLKSVLGANAFRYSYGEWVEDPASANQMLVNVQAMAGAAPMVDVRKPRYRVIILGRRNNRGDSEQVWNAAQYLMSAAIGDGKSQPCGAANVRAMGEPVGPYFTTENRAWSQVDLEVIY